jgi:hypothetical protein
MDRSGWTGRSKPTAAELGLHLQHDEALAVDLENGCDTHDLVHDAKPVSPTPR